MEAETHDLIIGGVRQPSVSGESFSVLSPSTREVIALVARGGEADVSLAVSAARKGFEQWWAMTPTDREAVLLRAADIAELEGEARFLDLLIDESGSAISKARAEISYTKELLRTAAGEVRRLYGETFPNDKNERLSLVLREPLGVVAVVSPYNAPLALLTKMAAFPLAAGNSVVIKPSEETPVIALAFAQLLLDAGMPANAVSVVCGFGVECGSPLVNHKGVDCIALTGSTETGKAIGAQAMQNMRRTQLELGGKSALLVLRDVDPAKAASIAAQGIFTHGGQICMANSRIIVDAPLFDDFVVALKNEAESLPVGDLRNPDTVYGPLINERSVEKVLDHIEQAKTEGAVLLTGGKLIQGLVIAPTVLIEPDRKSVVWREESFGPVCCVAKASNVDEAISLANDSEFGLSAAVLTNDLQAGFKAARGIKAGSVHIGMHSFQSNALAPIGGTGLSGIGRSGGKYSTEEFTELKWISVDLGVQLQPGLG